MNYQNDIKSLDTFRTENGLNSFAPITTSILVIDKDGNPLTSAHLKWNGGGVITNADGEAIVSVPSENTVITISYMGKRDHIAKFSDLVNAMVTLQDQINNLPPVVVGTKPPKVTTPKPSTPVTTVKKSNWVNTAAIGLGAVLLIAAIMGRKKEDGLNGPKSKKRKTKKTKKTKTTKKSKGLREPYFDPEIIDL